MKFFVYAAWSAAAGALIPVMAVLNARLARQLASPEAATLVLFAVALLGTIFLNAVAPGRWLSMSALAAARPIDFAGGLIVAFYVFSITLVAPRFGVANAILFVMVAQVLVSTAIDHFGWFGAALRPLSPLRVLGLVILLSGLALTQLAGQRPAQ